MSIKSILYWEIFGHCPMQRTSQMHETVLISAAHAPAFRVG